MNNQSSLAKLTPDATISDIVSSNHKAGQLLEAIGLKPSEYKNQSLRSVCRQLQWSENEVLNWLKEQTSIQNGQAEKADFGGTIMEWTEYLETEYQANNLERIKAIKNDFPRVHKIHGNQYTWLKNMQWQFDRFEEALTMYYRFEEQKFYPLLVKMEKSNGDLLYGSVKKLERSIEIIQKDQNRMQQFMKKLHTTSSGFKNPRGACSTLRILNQNFKTLFKAVKKQFEIEQEQLLPSVKNKMEKVY